MSRPPFDAGRDSIFSAGTQSPDLLPEIFARLFAQSTSVNDAEAILQGIAELGTGETEGPWLSF